MRLPHCQLSISASAQKEFVTGEHQTGYVPVVEQNGAALLCFKKVEYAKRQ